MARFKLVGHDSPLGKYPGPVVPIGTAEDGTLVAVYYSLKPDAPPILEPIDKSSEFIKHPTPESLANFDYLTDRLFAVTRTDLRVYKMESRADFYLQLLHDSQFGKDNPYLRFYLAKETQDNALVDRELAVCWSRLYSISPNAANSWYLSEGTDIGPDVVIDENGPTTGSPTILFVEDDRKQIAAVKDALRFNGYDIVVAEDGDRALARLDEQDTLSLVLLDVMIPKVDGFAICRHIRASQKWGKIPVIMATALGQLEEEQKGRGVGASAYIRKPFELHELLSQIAGFIGQGRKLRTR